MIDLQPHLPILQVVIPLLGSLLTAFIRRGTLSWLVTLIVTWTLPFIAVALFLQVQAAGAPIYYKLGNWEAPFGIVYKVDVLSAFMLCLVSGAAAVIMPFARKSVASEIDSHQQSWYYTMYLLCLAGLLGIIITNDAFNAFVFLEVSSLSTYVLIALGRHRRALVASYQYLIMGTIGATLYIIGVGLLYLLTGSLNFDDIAARLTSDLVWPLEPLLAALAFIFVGLSLKLALFPLHVWLPNAYAYAPSFATVFLAGTATKVAIYLLVRVMFEVFGVALTFDRLPVAEILIVLSVAAMFIASFSAVFEDNAKRMLAYSSVAQIGYITLGIGLFNQAGLTGAFAHVANHAVMKTALFLALGAAFYRIGSVRFSDLEGIGRRMPLTMGALVIAGIGLMGTPGTAGFISKWYLAMGALEAGSWLLVFLIVASSLISVIYVGKLVEVMWLRAPSPAAAEAKEAPLSMLVPLLLLAAATIYLGFDTRLTVDIGNQIATLLLGGLK
ncbi:NADH dehydrogenase (Quinone) [Candidatus Filomicrobium marinum]|uniref:NADH dehydrogenase (Quinone) n=2 Tax=Filomicrobium TaxID=119044 RepID=A0A0D6JLA0_9HYPH|nr:MULTISPECIES: monovalent cation/H+ antiporter subunit D family protein [Filomicrobium]MCV0369117.1 monovalent cation/H+ antiporter subunit D family protein [Filomicrobium sp.]CFX61194.1 NADH dehydrogenase (Quinone) [Candidatus Filomicrobium marinum]CPR22452.1 NADH dehydrogenase (Quinone) [Candidatus Filomicrobium marinum]SDO84062.1 multisubunit sodium/proton antiporter, MrpD subunit (TC 2.A.63.1) [Filomicrobium insigne]